MTKWLLLTKIKSMKKVNYFSIFNKTKYQAPHSSQIYAKWIRMCSIIFRVRITWQKEIFFCVIKAHTYRITSSARHTHVCLANRSALKRDRMTSATRLTRDGKWPSTCEWLQGYNVHTHTHTHIMLTHKYTNME